MCHPIALALLTLTATVAGSNVSTAQSCWNADALEPNDVTPAPIQEGSLIGLRFHSGAPGIPADHVDRFVVTLPPRARVTLALDSSLVVHSPRRTEFTGRFLVGGEVRQEFFQGLLPPDPSVHGGQHALPPIFENPTNASIDVEIELRPGDAFAGGCMEYDLHVSLDRRPCDVLIDDALEGPDDALSARDLNAGSHSGLVVFGPGRRAGEDADYFRLPTVAPGEVVRLQVSPEDPFNDALLIGLGDDPNGLAPSWYQPATIHSENPWIVARNDSGSSRDYYVYIASATAWDFVEYDVELQRFPDACGALQPDAFEPNRPCDLVAPIAFGVHGGLTLDAEGDLYEFTVPPDHLVDVEVNAHSPASEVRWSVVAAPGCPSPWDGSAVPLSAGMQTVRLRIWDVRGVCGAYDLSLTATPLPCTAAAGDGPLEPNDDCATAAPVALEAPWPATPDVLEFRQVSSVSNIDVDCFRIAIPPGDRWYVARAMTDEWPQRIELTAVLANDCGGVPIGTSEDGSLVLPNRGDADVEYVLRVATTTGAVGCVPYSIIVAEDHDRCPLLADLAGQYPGFVAGTSCSNAPVLSAGVMRDHVFLPGRAGVYEVVVPAGSTLDLSHRPLVTGGMLDVPVSVKFHDGAADCSVGGASLGSAVFHPDDATPSLAYTNSGATDRSVRVELALAPTVFDCRTASFVVELDAALAFVTDCLPSPHSILDCPCDNDPLSGGGSGCANATGRGGRLSAVGSAIVALDDLLPSVSDLPPRVPAVLLREVGFQSSFSNAFFDGLLCVGPEAETLTPFAAGGNGGWQSSTPLANAIGAAPGRTDHFQVWYRDRGGPCGTGSNTTNSIRVLWE